ncbi:MAG: branched-chain amino acid ABC transporter permease [Deltaproteobacteria bacterium]|nr:branched-chain amino acid ABC transporter permease [Deltaproteobacteria bacterium]
MTLKLIAEQLINGLVLGSMYAIVASGLTLIWGTMKMLNFAHGELYMLGGYVLYFTLMVFGMHPFWAVFLAMLVVFFVGVLIERLLLHPLLDKPGWDVSPLVVTLGISIFLQNFALKVWGERFKNVPYFIEGTMETAGFRIAYQRILILVVAATVMFGFWMYVKKSRFGIALRATAQDRESATILGINSHRIYMLTFGISSALAALAATMLAPLFLINPWMGIPPQLKAFIVVVLGGLGSFGGAILGGFLLGTIESLAIVFLSSEWKDVVSFLVLILILIIRPSGFFGTKEW